MHRHAEPIGGLLPSHRLDPLRDCTHGFAAAHRGECSEQKTKPQSYVLAQRSRVPMPCQRRELDSRCRKQLQDTMLDKIEIAPSEPGKASGR